HIAIVVEIAEGAAARRRRLGDARPRDQGNIFKLPIAQVAVHQLALGVAFLGGEPFHYRIYVAVADEDVGPAVVIHVEPAAAPAQKARVQAQTGGVGGVLEVSVAQVMVERVRVSGEVGFYDVQVAVQVVIAGGNAHSSLRFSVGAEGASRQDPDVLKFAVLCVLIKQSGAGIVGHVDIGQAVVVEVGGQHSQTIGAVGLQDSGDFRNIRERTISVVVIQNVLAAVQSGRAARHHN